ncbi:hypothetical protein B0G62_11760 [Paraburkholderia eburnea]|uniref:Short subunit dehydrogenase n=1 Tax=Paraburkholderia eburnea TaxID=1189126 RepID=A0A2S4LZ01_9BURK|nr:hypothetical protein B0G62_11760 [Paraburkholderia eburnea]PRZ19188.1 hypothetical protein BX588_11760 [Paraburkholderia eburnea]
MCRVIHAELKPLGIHATVVEPGYFRTDFLDASSLVVAPDVIDDASNPPLRLPLGTDTLAAIAAKNAYVTQETEAWKVLSASTDFAA